MIPAHFFYHVSGYHATLLKKIVCVCILILRTIPWGDFMNTNQLVLLICLAMLPTAPIDAVTRSQLALGAASTGALATGMLFHKKVRAFIKNPAAYLRQLRTRNLTRRQFARELTPLIIAGLSFGSSIGLGIWAWNKNTSQAIVDKPTPQPQPDATIQVVAKPEPVATDTPQADMPAATDTPSPPLSIEAIRQIMNDAEHQTPHAHPELNFEIPAITQPEPVATRDTPAAADTPPPLSIEAIRQIMNDAETQTPHAHPEPNFEIPAVAESAPRATHTPMPDEATMPHSPEAPEPIPSVTPPPVVLMQDPAVLNTEEFKHIEAIYQDIVNILNQQNELLARDVRQLEALRDGKPDTLKLLIESYDARTILGNAYDKAYKTFLRLSRAHPPSSTIAAFNREFTALLKSQAKTARHKIALFNTIYPKKSPSAGPPGGSPGTKDREGA